MQIKTYSITPTGKKHLIEMLLAFKSVNPHYILNEAKIALCCSDVLSINELIEFKENLLNNVELYKIKLQKGLENDYIALNDIQRKTIEITIEELDKLIELI